jgi:hypothetical protein
MPKTKLHLTTILLLSTSTYVGWGPPGGGEGVGPAGARVASTVVKARPVAARFGLGQEQNRFVSVAGTESVYAMLRSVQRLTRRPPLRSGPVGPAVSAPPPRVGLG